MKNKFEKIFGAVFILGLATSIYALNYSQIRTVDASPYEGQFVIEGDGLDGTEGDLSVEGPFGTDGNGIVLRNTSSYFSGNVARITYVTPTSGGNPADRRMSSIQMGENRFSWLAYPSVDPDGVEMFEIEGSGIDPKFYFGDQCNGCSNVSFLFDGTQPYILGTTKGFEWDPTEGARGELKFYSPIWQAYGTARFDEGLNSSTGTFTSGLTPPSRTKAQLLAISPTTAGMTYYCSDCSTDGLVVSTGTGVGAVARVSARTTVIN
jgi:hypothetical protein